MAHEVIPDTGLVPLLNAAVVGVNVTIRLYQSDIVPDRSTILADLVEATFSGYAPVGVLPSGSITVADHIASQAYETVTFTVGVGGIGNTVYGYFATDGTGGLLWCLRSDDAPLRMSVIGDQAVVLPVFSLESKYPLVPDGPPNLVGTTGLVMAGSAAALFRGRDLVATGGDRDGGAAGFAFTPGGGGHIFVASGGDREGGAAGFSHSLLFSGSGGDRESGSAGFAFVP